MAAPSERRDEFSGLEDLDKVDEIQLLVGAKKIEMLTEKGYKQLDHIRFMLGYMERESVTELLKLAGIKEKVIFYGIQDIISRRPLWKLYSIMNKLIPPYVKYYRLSPRKLHGIVTRVEF